VFNWSSRVFNSSSREFNWSSRNIRYLFRILPFRGPVGDTLEAWQAERAGRV